MLVFSMVPLDLAPLLINTLDVLVQWFLCFKSDQSLVDLVPHRNVIVALRWRAGTRTHLEAAGMPAVPMAWSIFFHRGRRRSGFLAGRRFHVLATLSFDFKLV